MNSKLPLIYILIINWNGYEDTIECIESLKKNNYKNYIIVLLDNGSLNDYEKLKNDCISDVILLRSEKNLGFAGGNNLGFKYCIEKGAEFILALNNDTIVEPDFLEKLVSLSVENNLAIAAPKILYYNNKKIIWSNGGRISKIGSTGYPNGAGKESSKFTNNENVTFVSGCCMLIRAKSLIDIGFFDENYYLYMEDIDLCRRTIDKGYKIMCAANSVIYHKVNASSKQNTPFLPIYYITRNRLYFAKKHNAHLFIFVKTYIYLSMSLKFIYWSLKGKRLIIKAVKTAFSDFNNQTFGKKEFLDADWN